MSRAFAFSLAFVLTSTVLAGCLGDEEAATASLDTAPAALFDTVAHTAAGLVPLPPGWEDLVVRVLPTGHLGGEPTLGVSSDGTIFVNPSLSGAPEDRLAKVENGGEFLLRSMDHGATWDIVGSPVFNPKLNLDPWMWVDPLTDRVFNAPLYVACTWMAWSDDKGETWDANPIAGCGIPAHDHQKLTTGPPPEGVTTTGYPNVIYYAYNSFRGEGTVITTSLDGGRTFGPGVNVHPADCKNGVIGGVGVGPHGTAYSAKPTCDGINVAVSRDGGETWTVTAEVNEVGIGGEDRFRVNNPDVTVDEAGNAYVGYTGADGGMFVTASSDQGETWSAPARVTPPHIGGSVFSVAAAGAEGRVAFGYLGTTSNASEWDNPDAHDAPDDVVWHAYMTFTENALDPDPVFTTVQLTPEEDPVQRGCIWMSGGSSPCRNMLDFIDMVQVGGRAYMVYADGCDACASADDSRSRMVTVAMVHAGPSLLGGPLEPIGLAGTGYDASQRPVDLLEDGLVSAR